MKAPNEIRHPEWCDPTLCTAGVPGAGEAHRGQPVVLALASGGLWPVTVTAQLQMAYAPWLTDVFVKLEWSGLTGENRMPVCGSACVPAQAMGVLLDALGGLVARASAAKTIEIAEYLARPPRAVA